MRAGTQLRSVDSDDVQEPVWIVGALRQALAARSAGIPDSGE